MSTVLYAVAGTALVLLAVRGAAHTIDDLVAFHLRGRARLARARRRDEGKSGVLVLVIIAVLAWLVTAIVWTALQGGVGPLCDAMGCDR